MNYLEYWKERGLDTITPRDKENPEGFNIGEVLLPLCPGRVLEVGCGTGRIAKFFPAGLYKGIDINPAAITRARAALPDHAFHDYAQGSAVFSGDKYDTVLFYTVLLHVPDNLIFAQLDAAAFATDRIVIAEIMNPEYRQNRVIGADYDISNQRSLEEYVLLMKGVGFEIVETKTRPYEHYPGQDITFAVFGRRI